MFEKRCGEVAEVRAETRHLQNNEKDSTYRSPKNITQIDHRDASTAPSSRAEEQSDALFLVAALVGIAAVAYADSLVVTISLGYLYVLPLSLSALTRHRRITLALVAVCVALHDWLGPYEHSGWPILHRSLLTLAGFLTVVLFVDRLARQRSQLMQTVRAQRDELALELKHAAEAQQRLLPQVLPDVPGMEFAGLMSPAKELCGDYYDFIQMPHGEIGLVIADVSGKGAEAALFMPSIEVALRMDTHNPSPTNDITQNLNKVLCELAGQTRYVTMFYSRLDLTSRTLHYTNAGHPPPCLLRGSDLPLWLSEGGPVVGLLTDATYQAADVALLPGDVLILYTDGVIEPENARGEQFSAKRLVEVAGMNRKRPAQDLVRAIHSSVIAFAGTHELPDDFTLLVVKALPDGEQIGLDPSQVGLC